MRGGGAFDFGAKTVHQQSLTDFRRKAQAEARNDGQYQNSFRNPQNISAGIERMNADQEGDSNPTEDISNYLMQLAGHIQGRGVNKSIQSPAELRGLNPQNPQYFGVGRKDAIPYQKVFTNGANLQAVMNGYQEVFKGGQMPNDAANAIAQASRRTHIVTEAFNRQKKDSIYAGVPKDPAVNLFNIKVRNRRRDSIYALY